MTYSLLLCMLPAYGLAEPKEDAAFSVVSVTTDRQAFDRPHDIELLGDLAFVPGKGGSLAILDVANPKVPKILWHRRDPKQLEEAETVLPMTGRLLLGTHDFISIDINNPQQPVFQSRISDRSRISRINGMVRRGNTILAASKDGWIDAFDISDPAAPTLTGAVNIRKRHDIGWPHDVDLFAEYAVVPDPRRFGLVNEPGKLALFQVVDKETEKLLPPERWKLAGVIATEQLVGANRVHVSGDHAFIAASTAGEGGRLVVVDLSDVRAPRQIAWLRFAPQDGWGPNGLTVVGQVVFLAGGQSVEAIDISRPQAPVKLASRRFTKELRGGRDSGHDLVYRKGYLYVTGQNDNCLMILRVESEQIRRLAEG